MEHELTLDMLTGFVQTDTGLEVLRRTDSTVTYERETYPSLRDYWTIRLLQKES